MSLSTCPVSNNNNNESSNSVVKSETQVKTFISTAFSTSTLVNNIRQLQTEFQAQHQHDKLELSELNERFRLFIDRVQLLESENSKYLTKIAALRQSFNFSGIDTQWSEGYLHLQSDFTAISHAQVDYEFDFELLQLQIGIYQQLIDVGQQWKGKSTLKLEEELKQSTDVLVTLHASYADLEREIASLYAARVDTFTQYLKIASNWCNINKQQKKWELNIQTLKSQIKCYKNLRSYSTQDFGSLSVVSFDAKDWSFDLDTYIKRIRHDFEQLYAAIYHEMTVHYEAKMVEVQKDVELAYQYQQQVVEEITMSQQMLQVEYEEVQTSFSYEKKMLLEFEATYSKLELELKSIQSESDQQIEIQSKEISSAQESIMVIIYDIEQLRRSTKYLESEIIIYRHLLDSSQIQTQAIVAHRAELVASETTEKFVVENEGTRKGSIGIKECATSGKYITLTNYSMLKDIDISKWILERCIDSGTAIRYTVPAGVRIRPNGELIIYSNLGANESVSDETIVCSLVSQKLLYKDLATWGMGNKAETTLFDQNGEEKASLTQTIVFERNDKC